jgi:methylisocitrate lyase
VAARSRQAADPRGNERDREMTERVVRFRRLHENGCFVIPNPWDVGSARALERLGFQALATTSSGFAWSLGRPDNSVTAAEALEHIRAIAAGVAIPVNADFENGFAVEPEGVAANVAAAVATGIAGVSIEDSSGDPSAPLFDFALAVERIRAARAVIDQSHTGVVLTARCETFLVGRPDLSEATLRLLAYAEAGADCLYAPGLREAEDIAALVNAVSPKPVNVLVGAGFTTVAELAALGVRRISIGGALARAAWTAFLAAAQEVAQDGTFTRLNDVIAFADLNRMFVK